MIRRKCDFCGQTYTAKTKRSKYCSDRCRVYAHQGKSAWVTVAPGTFADVAPLVPVQITEDEVTKAVVQLKGAAATLDAASLNGPSKTKPLCRKLAAGLLEVIEGAGL